MWSSSSRVLFVLVLEGGVVLWVGGVVEDEVIGRVMSVIKFEVGVWWCYVEFGCYCEVFVGGCSFEVDYEYGGLEDGVVGMWGVLLWKYVGEWVFVYWI